MTDKPDVAALVREIIDEPGALGNRVVNVHMLEDILSELTRLAASNQQLREALAKCEGGDSA